MICSSCKAAIPDDSLFCEECGARVDGVVAPASEEAPFPAEAEEAPKPADAGEAPDAGSSAPEAQPAPAPAPEGPKAAISFPSAQAAEATKRLEGKYAQIGLFAGALCVVVAVIGLILSGGGVETTSFGGDYQTYTYQGIAAISKEMELLNRLVCVGLGAFGVFMICHFGQMLSSEKEG